MEQRYCSPKRAKTNDDTCMTLKELKTFAKDYNKSFPDERIPLRGTKKELYNAIRAKLARYCGAHNREYCWIEQPFVDPRHKESLEENFRPKKPKEWYNNRYTWLNTFDILDVMKQYEMLYKDFMFMGVHPIDFQSTYPGNPTVCIGKVFCQFDIKTHVFDLNKRRFAIVLNLDKHNQSGSHWVSVYCNFDTKAKNFGVYYYDSVAYPPPKPVLHFMKTIQNQVKSYLAPKRSFEVTFNKMQKQTENTECGVFSIVFLTQMLKAKHDFEYVCQHMRRDSGINQIRDIIYRPSVFTS